MTHTFSPSADDAQWLQMAIELALRGEGFVEPNPMVGSVVVKNGGLAGVGWHQAFGLAHAEVNALADAGQNADNATVFVSLEPCCHAGKTPACTDLLVKLRPARVVVGCLDPNPVVSGRGVQLLRDAGIQVDVAEAFSEPRELIRPFAKTQIAKRPWVIGKWAVSLDGRTATAGGESQWITGPPARARVHQTRGRVDGIMTGIGTVLADNPLLTARPAGQRVAVRIVLDSKCRLPAGSKLANTAAEFPVLVCCGPEHDTGNRQRLEKMGIQFLVCPSGNPRDRLNHLLDELGRRQMTNILVESGGRLLGALEDIGELDEIHSYVAPTLIGGEPAFVPVRNAANRKLGESTRMGFHRMEQIGDDVLLIARRVANDRGF